MAVQDQRRAASGAYREELAKRAGAIGRFVLGDEFMPNLRRYGRLAENTLLSLGTAAYDLPNLSRAGLAAMGMPPIEDELAGRAPGPTPMTSQEAELYGLDYTPVPRPPSAGETFGYELGRAQANDPRWARESRSLQAENADWLARELGLSPLEEAGIEMMIPIGPPGLRAAGRAGEFAASAAKGARGAEGEKLLQRIGDLELLRGHRMGEAELPPEVVRRLESRVGRLEGAEKYPLAPDPVATAVPGLRQQPPEKAFEYVRMADKYRATDPRAEADVVEIAGKPVFFGQVSDDDLTELVSRHLDEAAIEKSATWYDDARDFVESLAPENRKLGAQLLAAWQVSQRNETTDRAWRKLMNVVLEERLGQPIPMTKDEKVAKQLTAARRAVASARRETKGTPVQRAMRSKNAEAEVRRLEGQLWRTRKTGALADEDVKKLLSGGEISDEEIGLKLHDFLDSAYGKTTRSIAGDDPRAGAPAVIDLWMKRIQGVWDDAGVRKLTREARAAGDEAAVAKLDAIRSRIPKQTLDRETPTPHEYEFMAEQIRRLAGKWSEVGFAGRSDWKPHEVQAVLWNAALRAHGDPMVFPRSALRLGDPATVSRAARLRDLGDLREAWVVASSWLGRGLDFEGATGWQKSVRSRLAERMAENATEAIYGRRGEIARKTSAEAAREGVSPNLPTVTSVTGRWRDDYEPSVMAYHPASTSEELEAYAAAMGVMGRQKAVYTFLEGEGDDALYLVRMPEKRRREVSDALLARGFEGQSVMDDGVALFDMGGGKRADVEDVAEELGLESPLVVRGSFQTHLDFPNRREAMERYAAALEQFEQTSGRKGISDVIRLAREEALGEAGELSRGAYAQREARGRGALEGPRPGRAGPGTLHGGLSQRDLRAKIEAGLERRRAAGVRPAPEGVERGRMHAEREGQVLLRDKSGAPAVATHFTAQEFDAFDQAKQLEARMYGKGYTTEYGRDFTFPRTGFFFFVGDAPPKVGKLQREVRAHLAIERPLDLRERISAEDSSRIIDLLQEQFNMPKRPGHAESRVRGIKGLSLHEARKSGMTPQQLWDFLDQNSYSDRGRQWDHILERLGKDGLVMETNSSGTSMLEPRRGRGDGKTYTVAVALKPEQIQVLGHGMKNEQGVLMAERGLSPRARQQVLPGVEPPPGARPRLPGTPGRTRPGALTSDPTRQTEIATMQTARGALPDFRPFGEKEQVTAIGASWKRPEPERFERALEEELAHYSYGSEVTGIPAPVERGNPVVRMAVVARPTQAEIDVVHGAMLGAGDAWSKKPTEIVLGDESISTREIARMARRLADRTGFTFPVLGRSSARPVKQPFAVDPGLGGLTTASGFRPGMYGGTAKLNNRMIEDAIGEYRPSNGLLVLVRHGMGEDQLRRVMAHETGHALIGLRDKDLFAHYLISRVGGIEWHEIYKEIVRNSRDHVRPQRWREAFERIADPAHKATIIDILDQQAPAADANVGSAALNYYGSGHETLADAVSAVLREPKEAEARMPRFTAALRKMVNEDPELKKRGVVMASFGGALLLADQALRDAETKEGGM